MLIRSRIFIGLLLTFLTDLTNANVANRLSIYAEKKYKRELQQQGLYIASQHVISLTFETLKPHIFDKKYATLVEFYNSYCGHCRRFAPVYNELASNLSLWSPDILQICALDCSVEENSDICREFEVMAYPTVRLFMPNTKEGNKTMGYDIGIKPERIVDTVTRNITEEENPPSTWPSFKFFTGRKEELFDGVPEDVKFIFLFFEKNTSLIGPQLILDLHKVKQIQIRRTDEVSEFGLSSESRLMVVNRGLTPIDLNIPETAEVNAILKAITAFLKAEKIPVPAEVTRKHDESTEASVSEIADIMELQQEFAIRERVKANLGTVYLADLEQALKHLLFVEVPSHALIQGEAITALQRLISVVDRYFPFNENGKKFIKNVREYVMNAEKLDGKDFDEKIPEFEKKYHPIFSSNRWIGCTGSKEGLRRYPCGLWTLFHYLTSRSAESEFSSDPIEILQAMHGYIKNFFGCSECSAHFQQMAASNKIWSVPTKDEAVLWLWSAHNEVNTRLSGDLTEDPEFPKIQFPSELACPACRRQASNVHGHQIIGEVNWDKTEVLAYLKQKNSPENIDSLGLQNETTRPRFMAQVAANRNFSAFTDLDIRMGMLLYVVCLVMMVIAVKLFLRRGYRKKLYVHDLLGKV